MKGGVVILITYLLSYDTKNKWCLQYYFFTMFSLFCLMRMLVKTK